MRTSIETPMRPTHVHTRRKPCVTTLNKHSIQHEWYVSTVSLPEQELIDYHAAASSSFVPCQQSRCLACSKGVTGIRLPYQRGVTAKGGIRIMLSSIKALFRNIMSNQPKDENPLRPATSNEHVAHVFAGYLNGFPSIGKAYKLIKIEHLKETSRARHEYLILKFQRNIDGHIDNVSILIDRGTRASDVIDISTANNSTTSLTSPKITSRSPSPSPTLTCSKHSKATLGISGTAQAYDRIIVPRQGSRDELNAYLKDYAKVGIVELGTAKRLATLSVTNAEHTLSMTQLGMILDIIYCNWSAYTLREHQCYWMSGIIFSFVEKQTGLVANVTEHVDTRGKLYGIRARAGSEETCQKMTQAEFDVLWNEFEVSPGGHCRQVML